MVIQLLLEMHDKILHCEMITFRYCFIGRDTFEPLPAHIFSRSYTLDCCPLVVVSVTQNVESFRHFSHCNTRYLMRYIEKMSKL